MITTTITSPITPRHYQLDGITYATTPRVKLDPNDFLPTLCRSQNTDAPGAGKTNQALWAADQLITNKSHSIVVICPAFLVDQWFNAIGELFPDDSIVSLEGQAAKRDKWFQTSARWYVISVQSLRRKAIFDQLYQLYIREHVDFTIIDESHYVKNPNAIQSINVRKLTDPRFCPHVMLLSATPITKEADDLYNQLRIIDPVKFRAQHEFLNKYCYFTWSSWGATNVTLRKSAHAELEAQYRIVCKNGDVGTRLCGSKKSCTCNELYYTNEIIPKKINTPFPTGLCCEEELDMQSGYMLGRTYAQIGLELPALIPDDKHAIVEFPLEKDRRKLYDDLKHTWYSMLAEGEVLTAASAMELMHLLRRITNSPEKATRLCQYMENDPGPYVIACFYKKSAKELAQIIDLKFGNDRKCYVISGEIDADERVRIAKRSTNPGDVVIATIPSISEGVDLSHANTVYFYEEDYTPGKMYQFLSRVRRHRDNSQLAISITHSESDQTDHLHIDEDPNDRPIIRRFFHAENTIDKRIHDVQTLRSVNIRDLVKVEITS